MARMCVCFNFKNINTEMKADEQNTGWRFGTTQYFFNFICFFISVINIIPQEATNKPIKIILQPRFYFFTFESKKKKKTFRK